MMTTGDTVAESSSNEIRAAVIQAAPVMFNPCVSLRKLADFASDAARRRAQLVVFPEAFIGGYPKGLDFGVTLGVRTPRGRDEFRRLFESAIEAPGPATESIGSVARDHAIHLVVGVIEREGGTLYCAALTFGPDGRLLGKHRKLTPTAMERVIWGSGDGSTLPVVATSVGKIGAVICWENYMPMLRTAMYAKGVEMYCAPTVDDRDTWIPTVRHIALEGRCFVLSACQFLRRSELGSGYPEDNVPPASDVLIRGGSCILGPLGQFLAGPVYDEECVVTATLDRNELARAKFDFDVVGHYSRPDIFRLTVNETAAAPVAFSTSAWNIERDDQRFLGRNKDQENAHFRSSAPPLLKLVETPGRFAICRLSPNSAIPEWVTAGDIFNVTRTVDELSVVCRSERVPSGIRHEADWRCLRVAGTMPFTLVGALDSLTRPVAAAGVGVFAVSTFDTDYLFFKEAEFGKAVDALRKAGHSVDEVRP